MPGVIDEYGNLRASRSYGGGGRAVKNLERRGARARRAADVRRQRRARVLLTRARADL